MSHMTESGFAGLTKQRTVPPFSPSALRPSKRHLIDAKPPTIVQKLKAQEVYVGSELILECNITANPTPQVLWTRNGIPLQKSERFHFECNDDGRLLLLISSVRIEDSGVYMVMAKNSFGVAKVSCQILVTSPPTPADVGSILSQQQTSRAPLIITYPAAFRSVSIGERVVIEIELKLFLDTRIIWFLNDNPLIASTRISTGLYGNIAKLVITNFQDQDYGVYCFRAVNSDGQSTYKFTLQRPNSEPIVVMNSPVTEMHNRRIAVQPTIFLERSLKPVQDRGEHIDLFAPLILKPIRNVSVRKGLNVIFDAKIKGGPVPTIEWIFNGKPLEQLNERVFASYDKFSFTATLSILRVEDGDYGRYSLVAKNSEGQLKCSAKLSEEFVCEELLADAVPYYDRPILSAASVPLQPSFTRAGIEDGSLLSNLDSIEALERKRKHGYFEDEAKITEKPSFLQPLPSEITVNEGDDLLLRALIQSPNVPEFIWLKDDGMSVSSNRVTSNFDPRTGYVSLAIAKVQLSDGGVYALAVKTQSGSCSSNCVLRVSPSRSIDYDSYVKSDNFERLEQRPKRKSEVIGGVDEKPIVADLSVFQSLDRPKKIKRDEDVESVRGEMIEIEEVLKDIESDEGSSAVFQARIKSIPQPKYTWFKNGIELQTGSRLRPSFDPYAHIFELRIDHLVVSDNGVYSLKAENSAGNVESSCTLKVKSCPTIHAESYRSPHLFEGLEDKLEDEDGKYVAGIDQTSYAMSTDKIKSLECKPTTNVDYINLDQYEEKSEPRFEGDLIDCERMEGDSLLLSIKLHATPLAKIEWFKDSNAIHASNRIKWNYDLHTKTASLHIAYLTAINDSGIYTIKATNPLGSKESSARINVLKTESIHTKSIFDAGLFEALEKSSPSSPPIIQPGVDTTAFVSLDKFIELEQIKPSKISVVDDSENFRKPTFISPFAAQYRCNEGNVLQLVCVLSGSPMPQFTVKRNGIEVQSSDRFNCDYNMGSKLFCLSIHAVRPSDSGHYMLSVENVLGKIECETNVTIDAVESIDTQSMIPYEVIDRLERPILPRTSEIEEAGIDTTTAFKNQEIFERLDEHAFVRHDAEPSLPKKKPELFKGLVSCEVEEGGDLCLFAQLFGLPIPEIRWTLSKSELKASSRFIIHYDILTKTAYLWVKSVKLSDSGQYECSATNELGAVQSSCNVYVKAQEAIDRTSFVSGENIQKIEERAKDDDRYSSLISGVDETSAFTSNEKFDVLEAKPAKTVMVDDAPDNSIEIIQPLKAYQMGENLVLEVQINKLPVREIVWMLNGRKLEESNEVKYMENLREKRFILMIGRAEKSKYEGEYEVIVRNKANKCRSKCSVQIAEEASIDSKTTRSLDKYLSLDESMIGKVMVMEAGVDSSPMTKCPEKFNLLEVKNIGEMEHTTIANQFPPKFTKGLQRIVGDELGVAVLSAVCEAQPLPTFTWFKNDRILAESNRFLSNFDIRTKTVSLAIVGLKVEDSALYTLVAVNVLGTEKSTTELEVIATESIVSSSDRKNIEIYENLEKKPIIASQYAAGIERNRIAVESAKSTEVDTVTAGVDGSGYVEFSKFKDFEKDKPRKGVEIQDILERKSPNVLSPFAATVSVNELENLTLHGTLEAYPIPEIEWTLNGRPITPSQRYIINYDLGTHLIFFQIRKIRVSDEGVHRLNVKNAEGSCVLESKVTVRPVDSIDVGSFVPMSAFEKLEKSPESIDELEESTVDSSTFLTNEHYKQLDLKQPKLANVEAGVDQSSFIDISVIKNLEKDKPKKVQIEEPVIEMMAPSLLKTLDDVEVGEHEDICLSGMLAGSPVPELVWMKDGRKLEASSKFVPRYDLCTKTAYLLIRHTTESDSGTYALTAENRIGIVTSKCKVHVIKGESVDRTPFVAEQSFAALVHEPVDRYADLQAGVDGTGMVPLEKYANLEEDKVKKFVKIETEPKRAVLTLKKGLIDLEGKEGDSFCLEAQLDGSPIPEIQWNFNGEPIRASDNYQPSYNLFTKIARLIVKNALSSTHQGIYEMVAFNGEQVKCNCRLKISTIASIECSSNRDFSKYKELDVKMKKVDDIVAGVDLTSFVQNLNSLNELDDSKKGVVEEKDEEMMLPPPQFQGPLTISNETANEFDMISMSVPVLAAHPVHFYIMKDGNLVMSSNRIATHHDVKSNILAIHIRDVLGDDSGSYYVVAHNKAGSALSSRVQLNILASPAIDSSSQREAYAPIATILKVDMQEMVPLSRFKHLEQLKSVPTPSPDKSMFKPPMILSPPVQLTVQETQNALVTLMIDGYPMPEFEWQRNGLRIPPSNRYSSIYDPNSKVLNLFIKMVTINDSGTFMLFAKNEMGQVSCQTCLIVQPIESIDQSTHVKSMFKEPTISPKSYESGIEQASFVNLEHFSALEKEKPSVEYSSGVDQSALIEPEKFVNLEKPPQPRKIEEKVVRRAPLVHQPLKNVEVVDGECVELHGLIDPGQPMAKFKWFKNDHPIPHSNRIQSDFDMNNKVIKLYIGKSTTSDMAKYSLRVSNEVGSVETSCQLIVSGTSNIDKKSYAKSMDKLTALEQTTKPFSELQDADQSSYEAPTFKNKQLGEIVMSEGGAMNLVFDLDPGKPRSTFTFFKNSNPIVASNRYFYRYDPYLKKLYFKIDTIVLSDAGVYECKAKNIAGKDVAQFIIIVHPTLSIDQSSKLNDHTLSTLNLLENASLPTTLLIEAGIDYKSYMKNVDVLQKLDQDKRQEREVEVVQKRNPLAPTILDHLKDIRVRELEPVLLIGRINNAYPICNVYWFHEGKPITPSNHCSMNYNIQKGEIFLYIPISNSKVHAGKYGVCVSNELGESKSEANLVIEPIDSIDQTTSRNVQKYDELEKGVSVVKDVEAGVSFEASDKWDSIRKMEEMNLFKADEHLQDDIPPTTPVLLISPLAKIYKCKESESVTLMAIIRANPLPKFEWFKNGRALADANRLKSHYDLLTGTIMLKISGIVEGDRGKYTLRASNVMNELICETDVMVEVTESILKSPITSDAAKFVRLDERVQKTDVDTRPEIDVSGSVPMDRFAQFEAVKVDWLPATGAEIDSGSIVGEETLKRLKQMDEYRISEVHEPLKREQRLKLVKAMMDRQSVVEGSPVSLFCTVDAFPRLPDIEWKHDGCVVEHSQRIVPHYDPYTGLVALHFMVAYGNDNGRYEVHVRNGCGEVMSECELDVESVPGIDETGYVSKASISAIEGDGFLMFPRVVRRVGKTVDFSFKLSIVESELMFCLLDGEDVSDRIEVKREGMDVIRVSFPLEVLASHDQLVCVARNERGVFKRTVCFESGVRAPLFEHELESCVIEEGNEMELRVLASGDPKVEWTKDDLPVSFKTGSDGGNMFWLRVDKCSRSDSGWYKCILMNEAGSATSACRVVVVNAQSMRTNDVAFSARSLRPVRFDAVLDRAPAVDKNIGSLFLAQLKHRRPVLSTLTSNECTIENIDMYGGDKDRRLPAFKIHLPKVLEVTEGSSDACKLQVTVIPINDPTMIVQWLKDGVVIDGGSDRWTISFEMGYSLMEMKRVEVADSGLYECVAKNRFGTDRTECRLICRSAAVGRVAYESSLSNDAVQKIERLEEQLRFVKLPEQEKKDVNDKVLEMSDLQDVEVDEGTIAKFAVNLHATCKPRIQWFVNGKVVGGDGRHRVNFDGLLASLVIGEVRMVDAGAVKCVVTIARTREKMEKSCRLKVTPAQLPVYWDLVMRAALDLDLSVEEINKIHKGVEDRILEHRKKGIAQSEAEKVVEKFIEEVRSKHAQLSKIRQQQQVALKPDDVERVDVNFVDQLPKSMEGELGASICLQVRFSGSAAFVSVKWFREKMLIENSRDCPIITDTGMSCLVIRKLSEKDEGKTYSAKLLSAIGSSECSTVLRLKQPSASSVPSIITIGPPNEICVSVGGEVSVQCLSSLNVNWTRSKGTAKMPLRTKKIDNLETNVRSLKFFNCCKADSGEYACSSIDGIDSYPFKLKVEDKYEGSCRILKALPSNISAMEGEQLTVQCEIEGGGAVWSKNGTILAHNLNHFQLIEINCVKMLKFWCLQRKDEGEYECRVNQQTTKTRLSVNEKAKRYPSLFKKTLNSYALLENDSLTLKFETTEISCSIEWFKDDGERPLIRSGNVEILYEGTKGLLFIPKASMDDSGIYTCVAKLKNEMESRCSAQVTVRKSL